MSQPAAIPQVSIERDGPPPLQRLSDADVAASFLADLTLKHVAQTPEPTTVNVADKLCLPRALAEELLQSLNREKLIEIRAQMAFGATRYAMLERGWERLARAQSICGYSGPAPVSLADYSHMMQLQAIPERPASIEGVRAAFSDLVLPESLIQTLGCVMSSRRSLFLTGAPGTGKTAIAERINAGMPGAIWIPSDIEVDAQVIRVFDAHNHRPAAADSLPTEHDRRWVCIERPLVVVGGELTLENADLTWSETARFYEAPFQLKANGGTLVIDDFGRQRVAPGDLLNRWIIPLERRVDYLTLHTGKKIEVPFEQLIVFSTNLDERDLVDEAFLRRMGYRARVEPPTPEAYVQIFKDVVSRRGLSVRDGVYAHILNKYSAEGRQMKACEPRDLIDRASDICRFGNYRLEITPELIDVAWGNYFGASHGFPAAGRSN